jgi:hypothetical protein
MTPAANDNPLQIRRNVNSYPAIHLENNTTGTAASVQLSMVVDSAENHGLYVTGNSFSDASVLGMNPGPNQVVIFNNTTGGDIRLNTRTSLGAFGTRVFVDSDGNVGIGTTSPGEKLHVDPATSGTLIRVGNYTGIGEEFSSGATVLGDNVTLSKSLAQMQVMTTHGSYGARALRLGSSEGMTFHAITGAVTAGGAVSNELLRITNAGNVGVGTASPKAADGSARTLQLV